MVKFWRITSTYMGNFFPFFLFLKKLRIFFDVNDSLLLQPNMLVVDVEKFASPGQGTWFDD